MTDKNKQKKIPTGTGYLELPTTVKVEEEAGKIKATFGDDTVAYDGSADLFAGYLEQGLSAANTVRQLDIGTAVSGVNNNLTKGRWSLYAARDKAQDQFAGMKREAVNGFISELEQMLPQFLGANTYTAVTGTKEFQGWLAAEDSNLDGLHELLGKGLSEDIFTLLSANTTYTQWRAAGKTDNAEQTLATALVEVQSKALAESKPLQSLKHGIEGTFDGLDSVLKTSLGNGKYKKLSEHKMYVAWAAGVKGDVDHLDSILQTALGEEMYGKLSANNEFSAWKANGGPKTKIDTILLRALGDAAKEPLTKSKVYTAWKVGRAGGLGSAEKILKGLLGETYKELTETEGYQLWKKGAEFSAADIPQMVEKVVGQDQNKALQSNPHYAIWMSGRQKSLTDMLTYIGKTRASVDAVSTSGEAVAAAGINAFNSLSNNMAQMPGAMQALLVAYSLRSDTATELQKEVRELGIDVTAAREAVEIFATVVYSIAMYDNSAEGAKQLDDCGLINHYITEIKERDPTTIANIVREIAGILQVSRYEGETFSEEGEKETDVTAEREWYRAHSVLSDIKTKVEILKALAARKGELDGELEAYTKGAETLEGNLKAVYREMDETAGTWNTLVGSIAGVDNEQVQTFAKNPDYLAPRQDTDAYSVEIASQQASIMRTAHAEFQEYIVPVLQTVGSLGGDTGLDDLGVDLGFGK